jgi:hypothetical protein
MLAMADIVFAVDESVSGQGQQVEAYLSSLITQGENAGFAQSLLSKGIDDIRYGVVGFGNGAFSNSLVANSSGTSSAAKLFGTRQQLIASNTIGNLTDDTGGSEDGWDALEHVIAEYNFRDGAVPVVVIVQNRQGRSSLVNPTLTRTGVLSALQSKNVLVNSLLVGAVDDASHDLFDLAPYGLSPDIRILGVEADVSKSDSLPDGRHAYRWIDTNTINSTADAPVATVSDALQISVNGSNLGPHGMVGSGKSVLITTRAAAGLGGAAFGDNPYRAESVPFEFEEISDDQNVHLVSLALGGFVTLTSQDVGGFAFPYFGQNRTAFELRPEGAITFAAAGSTFNPNQDLSIAADAVNPMPPTIAALMDSFNFTNSDVHWKTAGSGTSEHRLIVQWTDYGYEFGVTSGFVTFQAILYADGRIRFNYRSLEQPGAFEVQNNGRAAIVGVWGGNAMQQVTIPAGKYAPGPHAIFGSMERENDFIETPTETNDSYVRLAWDTGGAAWDLGVVVETSATSTIANRLRDDFLDSLGDQILRRVAAGNVYQNQQVLLALNLGGNASVDLGAAGVFRADNGAYTADAGVSGVDVYSTASSQQAIALASNAIPTQAAGMQAVFRTGRGERTRDVGSGNDGVAEHVAFTIDQLDNGSGGTTPLVDGRYVVELFFAEPQAMDQDGEDFTRSFDVVLEGQLFLHAYNPFRDAARINTSGATEFSTLQAGSFAGIVKRFVVDVATTPALNGLPANPAGLQIALRRTSNSQADPVLSAVRILRADPPRVENVIVKGSTWAPGVEFSFAHLVGAGQQLRPLPVQNANTIEIHFDGPVNLTDGALRLAKTVRDKININGAPTNSIIAGDAAGVEFNYDPVNFIARWKFPASGANSLESGKYALFLRCSEVTGGGGQHLDGDWDHNFDPTLDNAFDNTTRPFSVGNGTPNSKSGYFRLNFGLLVGDYSGSGRVDGGDLLYYLWNVNGGFWSFADGTGDGLTNYADIELSGPWQSNAFDFLALQAAHGADLKDDDYINGGDLAIWKVHFALTGQGDVDGDGDTDNNDFLLWQTLYGTFSAWREDYPIDPTPAPLTGDFTAPRVINVIISGSHSTHPEFSFDTVAGSGQQLRTVPLGGADTISIVFSEPVNVGPRSLEVIGLHSGIRPVLVEFIYNAGALMATWRFEGWALADQYVLSLADTVSDVYGNALDGEWVNPQSNWSTTAAISEFPSGDGNPGGDFNFVVTLLPGDANLDGAVTAADFVILINNFGALFGRVFSEGDYNGDGATNQDDWDLIASTYGLYYQVIWIWCDIDGDRDVDENDLLLLANNVGKSNPTWQDGDLDGNGVINMADLDIALSQFGRRGLFVNSVW